jgi:hypothetical protein
VHPDINDYLHLYVPKTGYSSRAGALRFLSASEIEGEITSGAWPGSIIVPYGMLPIARTLGGNLLCLMNKNGNLRLADHGYIREDYMHYKDESGALKTAPLNEVSLNAYTHFVANDLSHLAKELLQGEDSNLAKMLFEIG